VYHGSAEVGAGANRLNAMRQGGGSDLTAAAAAGTAPTRGAATSPATPRPRRPPARVAAGASRPAGAASRPAYVVASDLLLASVLFLKLLGLIIFVLLTEEQL